MNTYQVETTGRYGKVWYSDLYTRKQAIDLLELLIKLRPSKIRIINCSNLTRGI